MLDNGYLATQPRPKRYRPTASRCDNNDREDERKLASLVWTCMSSEQHLPRLGPNRLTPEKSMASGHVGNQNTEGRTLSIGTCKLLACTLKTQSIGQSGISGSEKHTQHLLENATKKTTFNITQLKRNFTNEAGEMCAVVSIVPSPLLLPIPCLRVS